MPLTAAQAATLRATINADPVMSAYPINTDGFYELAAYLNKDASPDYIVWRTNVPVEEIMGNGFVWTAVDTLAAGKARIWEWMTQLGYINPSKVNVRQGVADAFGANSAMTNGIIPHCKRKATRAEKLFATGTGTDSSPATMTFEGMLNWQDIDAARSN